MSTDADGPRSTKILLTYESGEWIARDERTGVTGTGDTRTEALEALDDALDRSPDHPEPQIGVDDPLFGGGSLYASDDPLDESEIDDRLYGRDE